MYVLHQQTFKQYNKAKWRRENENKKVEEEKEKKTGLLETEWQLNIRLVIHKYIPQTHKRSITHGTRPLI